jgi:hypothetical protein
MFWKLNLPFSEEEEWNFNHENNTLSKLVGYQFCTKEDLSMKNVNWNQSYRSSQRGSSGIDKFEKESANMINFSTANIHQSYWEHFLSESSRKLWNLYY